jgi:hypothetical protein
MAQHDMNIANQSFPSFRTDLNNALTAINTMHSGTSRPSGAAAGTMWLDTTSASSPTIKFFDGTDDISFATIDYSANTVNFLDSTVVADLVGDTTPQLGGNLDLNSNNITGTGDISITGSQILADTTADADGSLGSQSPQLIIQGGNSNNPLEFGMDNSGGTAIGFIQSRNVSSGAQFLSFNPNGGNVGIGTVSPTATFTVDGNALITQQALTSSSNAVAWDSKTKPNAYHLTTENTTFSAPTNSVEGAFICLEINYNGSHTIAFNTVFEFAASTAPTFTSTDGKTDILVFRYNGAVWQEVGRTLNLSES